MAVSGPNVIAAADRGMGIFLSTDNGKSWNKIKSSSPAYSYVMSIYVDGSNTFAGTESDIYLSTDHGISWTMTHSGVISTRAFASTGSRLFAGGDQGPGKSTCNFICCDRLKPLCRNQGWGVSFH